MRLSKITIRRFKCLDDVTIVIPKTDPTRPGSADFVSIVGENNMGKSSVLQAIALTCQGGWKPPLSYFPEGKAPSKDRAMEVELFFDEVSDADAERQGLRGHVINGTYQVLKRWTAADTTSDNFVFRNDYEFPGLDAAKSVAQLREDPEWSAVLEKYDTSGKLPIDKLSSSVKTELRRLAIQMQAPCARPKGKPDWSENPGGADNVFAGVLPRIIFLRAIQPTDEITSAGEKKSPVAQVVRAMFEKHLDNHPRIEAFRSAARSVEDLFGDQTKLDAVASIEQSITEKLNSLIGISVILRLGVPGVSVSDISRGAELLVRDAGIETAPEHQGHGAQRALVLALLQTLAEHDRARAPEERSGATLLLLEEPEIYTHPEMCRKMRDVLVRIARTGVAQVICTTHSPVFLNLADRHDGIVILRKQERRSVPVQRSDDIFGSTQRDRREWLRMILNFDPAVSEVFFAKRVVLVEGDTEIAAIEAIAERLFHTDELARARYLDRRRQVAIVNCRGKWTIPAIQDVLNAFSIPYHVVHDEDDDDGPRAANQDILDRLGGETGRRLVHSSNFEQQMFQKSWKRAKAWRAAKEIRAMTALGTDLVRFFEFVLGCSLQELTTPTDVSTSLPVRSISATRRSHLKRFFLPSWRINEPRLAAGAFGSDGVKVSTIDDLSLRMIESELDGERVFCARITGRAMVDTLLPGDIAIFRPINAALQPIDDRPPIPFSRFSNAIPNGIYVVALNRNALNGKYFVRRVKLDELTNGTWHCRISSDGSATNLEYRDHRVSHGDYLRIIAQLVGLAEGVPEVGWDEPLMVSTQLGLFDAPVRSS